MKRHQLFKMEQLRRGGIKCHQCAVRLNSRNLEYTRKTYPMGTTEHIPTCRRCANNGEGAKK